MNPAPARDDSVEALDALGCSVVAGLAFQCAPVGLIYSERRIIRCANEAFATMFGVEQRQTMGMSIELLYPSHEDSARRVALAGPVLQCMGYYSDERVMARGDGQLFWCTVNGRSLTPEDPFARAIWCFIDQSREWDLGKLSARDRQLAILICEGKTAKEMARLLQLSPRTVETYMARLKRKLQVRNATELVSRLRAHPDHADD